MWAIAIGALLVLLYELAQSSNDASSAIGSLLPASFPSFADTTPAQDSPSSIPQGSGVNITAPGDISTGGDVNAISKFVLGIWKTEGMGANDRSVRNNNPGNLKYAGQPGATADSEGFAVFSDLNAGFNAAIAQVHLDATRTPDFTILQEMRKWLGMDPNGGINVTNQGNALTKAQTVAATVGAKPTDTLRNVLGG